MEPEDADDAGRFDDADEEEATHGDEERMLGDQLKLLPFLVGSGRAAGNSAAYMCDDKGRHMDLGNSAAYMCDDKGRHIGSSPGFAT